MLDPRTEAQRVPEIWMPLARTDDLVMTEFDGEVFLYDLGGGPTHIGGIIRTCPLGHPVSRLCAGSLAAPAH
jgi:hypothetical protein